MFHFEYIIDSYALYEQYSYFNSLFIVCFQLMPVEQGGVPAVELKEVLVNAILRSLD